MDETVSVRIPSDVVRALDGLSEAVRQTRSDLLREVIHKGLERKRLEVAIAAYKDGAVSLGRAAEMADVPIHRMMEELRRNGVLRNYTTEDLRADLAWAKSH